MCEPKFDTDEIPNDSINRSVSDDILNLSSNAAVMGLQNIASSMSSYHPSLSQSVALLEVFKERVLPLVHIFHLPTLMHHYRDAVASLDTLDRNSEALLFAIYYSTVISMESEQCESVVGAPREVALRHYQFAVQQAIARADLLNTQSMVLLQAVVLFLSALRNVDPSRRAWSMTALIFHTARAMGLHRDGTAFGLPPFETELRRRLWWHICFLDIRSSEHHGCQPIVQDSAFDTRMPLNINDSDLAHGMKEAPLERKEATEMTFCIIRCEVLRVAWKISYFAPSDLRSDQNEEATTPQGLEKMTRELQEKLEVQYLKYCDPSVPFFKMTINVARIIIARMWLAIYYPPEQKCSSSLPATSRDNMFTTAIDILELSTTTIDTPELAQWAWHSKTHIQWHAVVIVLAEICSRPPSAECDRAWEYTNMIYNKWNLQNDNRSPGISIKRLMAKARRVREIQQHTERETNLKANLSTSFHSGTEIPTISQKEAGETLDPEGYDEEILLEPLNVDQTLLNKAYDEIESMYNDYTMGDWIKNDCDIRFSSS